MNKQKQAFTLVELIVVITILAILWTIAFISLQWYSKDARDSIRISDISSMKTSLELFHLDAGKYPLPDDNEVVDYGTEALWYQWDFWSSVISNLSRSMTEVPTDPLTDKKYVFSVANNKNEFEILSLLEWDSLALNNINQTNAASLVVTPKIDWTYNRVFIETANYIVPVPSIINTEVWEAPMTLDSNNISSQIINWGENIPVQWNVISNTWALTWLVLSVYTWSIDINTSNSEKENVMQKIKDAYTWSVLASNDIYNFILSSSWELEDVTLVNSLVLKDDSTEVTIVPNPYSSCTALNTPTPFDAITTYDSCDIPDTIVCSWENTWITVAWCNVWASVWSEYALCIDGASCTEGRVWLYFQFGRNISYPTAWTGWLIWYAFDWEVDGWIDWIDDWSANYWGIYEADKGTATYNNSSSINQTKMQWPCLTWYHIPSQEEWGNLKTAGDWLNSGPNIWINMWNDIKIPKAGTRDRATSNLSDVWSTVRYWSSTPNSDAWYFLYSHSNLIAETNTASRATGFPIRCFKN
jgi:prepilin-type N-terminal cleavage/methylation domain-containing protein